MLTLILISCIVLLSVALGYLLYLYIRTTKSVRKLEGLLQSEYLKKEVLKKENNFAFLSKEDTEKKLKEAQLIINEMEADILLLQKDNEDTESLLKITQPEIHQLKLKLIEANNTIVRLKSQLQGT